MLQIREVIWFLESQKMFISVCKKNPKNNSPLQFAAGWIVTHVRTSLGFSSICY